MKYLVCVMLVFVLVGIATAGVEQGDIELNIAATMMVQNTSDDSLYTTMVAGGIGYFFTDAIEVSLSGLSSSSWSDESDTEMSLGSLGMNLKYHFLTESTVVPYAGIQALGTGITVDTGTDSTSFSGITWGPIAGVKFFLSEKTSVFLEYQYQVFGGDLSDYVDDGHMFIVGLSIALGGPSE